MLALLQSLFGPRLAGETRHPQALVDAVIERAVDGTDPRIRALGNYRSRLREPAIAVIDHVSALVEALPPPVAADAAGYRGDPRLRALFASFERLVEVLGKDRNLEAARAATPGAAPLFGLLAAQMREKHVLGLDIEDEILKREVRQTVVSFDAHRVLDPAPQEAESRRLLKRRAFDHLLAQVLAEIRERRGARQELGSQRELLGRKLALLRRAGWSFEDEDAARREDPAQLERELAGIERELAALGPDSATLGAHLELLADALSEPAARLRLAERSLALDHCNVLREGTDPSVPPLRLPELADGQGRRVVLVMLEIDPALLPRTDFFAAARRYL